MAMTLVSTTTVGSGGAASIEFTNIPQTGKDLLVLVSGRGSNNNSMYITLNSDTSSARSVRYLEGTGSAANTGTISGTGGGAYFAEVQSATSNTFANSQFYLSNYTSSTTKSFSVDSVAENNATTAYSYITAGSYSINSGITTITLYVDSGNFVQHSTASLYLVS